VKRRHLGQIAWIATVLVLAGSLLPGCAPAEKPKITFVYSPYTDYAPAMVAEDKGYFDDMGLDVELMPKGGLTAETYQLLASGEVTCGGSSWGASFFNAVSLGTMVSIVSPMATMPTSGKSPSPLMVSKSAYDSGEVTSVADLKGKRIGIPGPGGFGEYSTILALQSAGLTADDVELVNIGPPEIGVAMENGSIVASWTIEPFTTFLEREGIAVVLDDTSARGVELGFLAFDTGFADENPAKFLAAYLKAYRELNSGGWDDPEIQKIVEKYTELPSDVLTQIGLTVLSPDYTINWDSVRAQEDYFRSQGVLEYEGELDFDAIYRKDILERALEILGE
jgi:NitT/TauT family transport system substrate-binding protein